MGKENLENPEKKFTSVGAKIQEAQKSEFLVCTVHTEQNSAAVPIVTDDIWESWDQLQDLSAQADELREY